MYQPTDQNSETKIFGSVATMFPRAFRLSYPLGAFFWLAAFMITGCNSQTYSAEFKVISHFGETIHIKRWDGFGNATPAGGIISPGARAGNEYPRLKRIPETTTVTWTIGESREIHSQTIELRDIVPRGEEGELVFTIDEDGHWSVEFEGR